MSAFTMRREGSKVVYDRIHWLEPSSVDPMGWVLDGSDNLERIERTYSDAQRFRQGFKYQETLPIEQVILFVHEMVGARYEGRPLIRSMYGAWLRKVFMQRHQAIRMQKFAGGGPPLGIYPAGWTDQEMLDEFESAVKGN
ncbi:MAG: hypothetical protein GY725_00840, partial [bacterium]|nr:hypothetical protein [bacterium]